MDLFQVSCSRTRVTDANVFSHLLVISGIFSLSSGIGVAATYMFQYGSRTWAT